MIDLKNTSSGMTNEECLAEWEPFFQAAFSQGLGYERKDILHSAACGDDYKTLKPIMKDFNIEVVEVDDSGEGQGEHCYAVFKKDDKFFYCEYEYYSYNGHEWDYILSTLREVVAEQRTVTYYV